MASGEDGDPWLLSQEYSFFVRSHQTGDTHVALVDGSRGMTTGTSVFAEEK